MTEPKRWADDDADLTDEERRVFAVGLRPREVPKDMENAVWGALGAKLPLGAAGATVGAAAGKTAATLSLVKVGLTGVLLGSVATGAWIGGERLMAPADRHASPAPSAVAPARTAPRPALAAPSAAPAPALDPVPDLPARTAAPERPTASRESPSELSTPSSTPHTEPRVAPERSVASFPLPAPAAPSAAGSALLESRRIAEARSRLRGGDARGALAALESVRRDFPGGLLAQERDALTIEALLALGDRKRARGLATEFLARYPGSPHRAAAERALNR